METEPGTHGESSEIKLNANSPTSSSSPAALAVPNRSPHRAMAHIVESDFITLRQCGPQSIGGKGRPGEEGRGYRESLGLA